MVPSINSKKFYSLDPLPQKSPLDDHSDEELLDWGEEEDILANVLADDDVFLEDDHLNQFEHDSHPADLDDV